MTLRYSTSLLTGVLAGLLILSFSSPPAAPGQSVERRGFEVEGAFGWRTLLGGAFPHSETGIGGGGDVRYLWPSGVSLGVGGFYSEPEDLSLDGSDDRRLMEQLELHAEVRYRLRVGGSVRPYLGLRAGWNSLRSELNGAADGSGPQGALVLGAEARPYGRLGVQARALTSVFGASGFPEGNSSSGTTWQLQVGVSYFLGDEERDGDGDGVRDRWDECANTPAGAEVDADGCLVDADGDGVGDRADACPDTPAGVSVDRYGCASDEDSDRVPDERDRCPGTPAGLSVDADGCAPDDDADGVPDAGDRCPGTREGAEVDSRGCPIDSDADGVPDERDRCEATPRDVEVDPEGCDRLQTGLRGGEFVVTGFPFRFRQVTVNQEFGETLERIGDWLQDEPGLRLEIRVYTDTVGEENLNRQVSQRLAEAVRQHILRRYPGVRRGRLRPVGAGEASGGAAASADSTAQATEGQPRVEFRVIEPGEEGGTQTPAASDTTGFRSRAPPPAAPTAGARLRAARPTDQWAARLTDTWAALLTDRPPARLTDTRAALLTEARAALLTGAR